MPDADRFTPRAKKALRLAEDEAGRLRHHALGPQHLLLGLVRESEGIAGQVLLRHGVDLDSARAAVSNSSLTNAGFEEALTRAALEADNLGHSYIGTEHLLMAVLDEDILRNLADTRAIDAELRVVISLAPGTYVVRGPKDNVVTCRVDDPALNAIDALVEAGIRTTRSDAAAWLIRSGIEANRDFFTEVYSTVTEIRRLRERAQALARQEHV